MGAYTTEALFERACYLARDRNNTAQLGNENSKKGAVEVFTAGLLYDTYGYISCDEYILIIDLMDGGRIYYDGYHDCFCNFVRGEYLMIDEEKELPIFSSNLRDLIRERGLNHETLAKAVRVHPQTLVKYIEGKRLPTYDQMSRICIALNCHITDLTLPH